MIYIPQAVTIPSKSIILMVSQVFISIPPENFMACNHGC